jgi:predicted metal-dependent hydrolase
MERKKLREQPGESKKPLPRLEPREWFYSFPDGDQVRTVRIRRFYDNPKSIALESLYGRWLELRIPWSMTTEDAEKWALAKREWIRKVQSKKSRLAKVYPPPLCRYVDGEEHPYLGKPYPIRLQKASRKSFFLENGSIYLNLPSPERPEKVQELLWEFYRQKASRFCEAYCCKHLPRFKARGMRQKVQIRIRRLTGSWGRCGWYTGKISMNLFLAACPELCIEGVMVHELCHLFHPNHSPAFYAFFDSMLPDWRERWKLLRGVSLSVISRKYPR